jgi:hypothetical protein
MTPNSNDDDDDDDDDITTDSAIFWDVMPYSLIEVY